MEINTVKTRYLVVRAKHRVLGLGVGSTRQRPRGEQGSGGSPVPQFPQGAPSPCCLPAASLGEVRGCRGGCLPGERPEEEAAEGVSAWR